MGADCNNCNESSTSQTQRRDRLKANRAMKTTTVQVSEDEAAYRRKVDKIWEQYDINGDGVLSKEEVVPFLKATLREVTGKEPSKDELDRNFSEMDRDKSGDIDKEECFKFLQGFHLGHNLRQLMGTEKIKRNPRIS